VASTAAFQPLPDNATYAATKAFVLSHSEALHTELKGSGVTVTVVCPGPSRTEFAETAGNAEAGSNTPGFVWTSAEDIVAQAVGAAEKGKRSVVPGLFNQAGALAGRHTPRTFLLPTIKRVWDRVN
jgi:short-subunit dehydrogenase